MKGLSSEGEDLVREGRAALKPSDADRDRVLAALLPQITGNAGAGAPDAASGTAAAKATAVKTVAVLVGLGVAGAGLFLALRSGPPRETTGAVAPPAQPQSAPARTPIEEAPGDVAPVAPQARTIKRTPVAPRPVDGLAQEVAILSRASAALHAGRPEEALGALADHQRKFPTGVLMLERTAARVQALCALDRMQEARAELARLSRMSPSSPHEARARKACGFAPTDK